MLNKIALTAAVGGVLAVSGATLVGILPPPRRSPLAARIYLHADDLPGIRGAPGWYQVRDQGAHGWQQRSSGCMLVQTRGGASLIAPTPMARM